MAGDTLPVEDFSSQPKKLHRKMWVLPQESPKITTNAIKSQKSLCNLTRTTCGSIPTFVPRSSNFAAFCVICNNHRQIKHVRDTGTGNKRNSISN